MSNGIRTARLLWKASSVGRRSTLPETSAMGRFFRSSVHQDAASCFQGAMTSSALRLCTAGKASTSLFWGVVFLGDFLTPRLSHLVTPYALGNERPGGTVQMGPRQPRDTKQFRAAYGPYLKRFATSVGALRAGAALACLKCAEVDGVSRPRSHLHLSSSGGAAAALAKSGFFRKITHSGA